MLTRKQHQLLLFINGHLRTHGVSPSFEEMKDALDLRSKSGIHRLITGLEERGFIQRLAHRARALKVVRLPEDAAAGSKDDRKRFDPKVIRGDFARGRAEPAEARNDETNGVSLPMMGKIAAGTPIEALREENRHVSVPPQLLGKGKYYALEVEGDSMIDAGIHDGDTIVIERCDGAEPGSVVVALVEGEEVTLKKLRKRHNSIALEPANRAYETRIFGPEQVAIQGRLVGLIRGY